MAVALQHRGPSYFLNPNPSSGGGESGSGGVGGKKLDLEMIYEEEDGCELIEEDHGHSSGSTNSYPGGGVGFGGRGLLFKQRSRSLPQEEFIYLTQKLRELDLIQRTDSIISGQSARYVKSRKGKKNCAGKATMNSKSILLAKKDAKSKRRLLFLLSSKRKTKGGGSSHLLFLDMYQLSKTSMYVPKYCLFIIVQCHIDQAPPIAQ